MNPGTVLVVIVALAAAWIVQLALAYRQAMAFNRRLSALRTTGRTAVGKGGNRARGVAYCALAIDGGGIVRGAEILRGITVFARPRSHAELVGRPIAELASGPTASPTERAIADAAALLLESEPDTERR